MWMTRHRRAASGLLLASVIALSCGRWPPVVTNVEDVAALPAGEKRIRCIGCGDEALAAIGRRLQDLDYLFINNDARITDVGIQAISTLRHLRQLEVGSAAGLTDASITAINQLTALEELSIENASEISSGAFQSLGASTRLRRLFLIRCKNASAQTTQILRQRLPGADVRVIE